MDEIDGMNSSDKGGLTELMSIMFKNKTKKTNIFQMVLHLFVYPTL